METKLKMIQALITELSKKDTKLNKRRLDNLRVKRDLLLHGLKLNKDY